MSGCRNLWGQLPRQTQKRDPCSSSRKFVESWPELLICSAHNRSWISRTGFSYNLSIPSQRDQRLLPVDNQGCPPEVHFGAIADPLQSETRRESIPRCKDGRSVSERIRLAGTPIDYGTRSLFAGAMNPYDSVISCIRMDCDPLSVFR